VKLIARQAIFMFPQLKRSTGGHKFRADCQVKTVVTQCADNKGLALLSAWDTKTRAIYEK
jgi:hypothetical protein